MCLRLIKKDHLTGRKQFRRWDRTHPQIRRTKRGEMSSETSVGKKCIPYIGVCVFKMEEEKERERERERKSARVCYGGCAYNISNIFNVVKSIRSLFQCSES
jgi:hypothetical protein